MKTEYLKSIDASELKVGDIFQHNNYMLWRVDEVSNNEREPLIVNVVATTVSGSRSRSFGFGRKVSIDLYGIETKAKGE